MMDAALSRVGALCCHCCQMPRPDAEEGAEEAVAAAKSQGVCMVESKDG